VYAVGGTPDDPALAAPSAAALLRVLFAVNQKRDREPAITFATSTLDAPTLGIASTLRALLVLLYAEEFAEAECRLRQTLADGQTCPAFTLLLARIVACQGRSREAAALYGDLLNGRLPADLVPATVAWRIAALVDLGELEPANELLRLHGYDHELTDVPDRAEVLAARGALHLAEGRFGLAYDDYSACGRELTAWAVVTPAVANWRSYAALCAHMTRRNWLAKTLASDEVVATRSWGGRRTSGIALQIAARLAPEEETRASCCTVRTTSWTAAVRCSNRSGSSTTSPFCGLSAATTQRRWRSSVRHGHSPKRSRTTCGGTGSSQRLSSSKERPDRRG
jgi:hypothetical protein